MKRIRVFILFISLSFSFSYTVFADQGEMKFSFSQQLAASLNPDGLRLKTDLSYKIPVFRSTNILFRNSGITPGFLNIITPSYEYAGVNIDIEPIAVFDLKVETAYKFYYTLLGYGLLYQTGYHTDKLRLMDKSIPKYSRSTFFFHIIPSFKIKIGKIIAVSSTDFEYVNIYTDRFFLEETFFVNMHNKDWVLKNDSLLLYEMEPSFWYGLYSEYIDVLNKQPGSGEIVHRISGIVVYTLSFKKFKLRFNGVLGWHIRSMCYNSWKKPYLALAVSYIKE